MSTTTSKTPTTLRDLAGTGRGLGAMTVEEIRALLDAKAPAKVTEEPKAPKAPSKFYTEVIVGGREKREARKAVNTAAAEWMREKNLVPGGQAWEAVKNGERSVKKLAALNAADGLTKAKAETKAETKVEVEVEVEVEAKTATKTPRRTPRKPKAAEAPEVAETDKALAVLIAGGWTAEQAQAVLALR